MIDIDEDEYLTLMDTNGEMKEDLTLPNDDVGKDIRNRHEEGQEMMVTVLEAVGQERVVTVKQIIDNS